MIAAVHLVWAPLGPEPLGAFLRSYRAHPAGAEHELVLLVNGLGQPGALTREQIGVELVGVSHRMLTVEGALLDLAAYGSAARQLEHDRLCFLNSYSVILADGWLGALEQALAVPGVALAGATGSWESQAEWRRGKPIHWLYQLAGLRAARRDYPRFPNPHIRTTAFAVRRADVIELGLESASDKRATYLLESGHRSITRHLQEAGGRVVVVGRDGHSHDVQDWARSGTYRSAGQRNLLVADRRTSDWERASERLRKRLSRDAWGSDVGV